VHARTREQDRSCLLGNSVQHQRCSGLLVGLADRAPERQCSVERGGEGDRRLITYGFIHADDAVDLVADSFRLSLRVTGIKDHKTYIVLHIPEESDESSLFKGLCVTIFIFERQLASLAPVAAKMNDVWSNLVA